jgi:hypothetical protein
MPRGSYGRRRRSSDPRTASQPVRSSASWSVPSRSWLLAVHLYRIETQRILTRSPAREVDEIRFLKGLREEVTLQEVESIAGHSIEHVFRFDAFRHSVETEAERELSHCSHDGIVGSRRERAHDEALINLQLVEWKVGKRRKGRVARPKIVYGDANSGIVKRSEETDRLQEVDRSRLCHLDGQAGCRQTSSGKFLENPIREIWRIDRRRRKVHPYGYVNTDGPPANLRLERLAEDPVGEPSARGTNRVGDTLPWTGLFQRRRASTDAKRAVAVAICGW